MPARERARRLPPGRWHSRPALPGALSLSGLPGRAPRGLTTPNRGIRIGAWAPACAAGGLPALRFHDLRSMAATALVASAANVKTAQTRVGHSSPIVTLAIYSRPRPRLIGLPPRLWGPTSVPAEPRAPKHPTNWRRSWPSTRPDTVCQIRVRSTALNRTGFARVALTGEKRWGYSESN